MSHHFDHVVAGTGLLMQDKKASLPSVTAFPHSKERSLKLFLRVALEEGKSFF